MRGEGADGGGGGEDRAREEGCLALTGACCRPGAGRRPGSPPPKCALSPAAPCLPGAQLPAVSCGRRRGAVPPSRLLAAWLISIPWVKGRGNPQGTEVAVVGTPAVAPVHPWSKSPRTTTSQVPARHRLARRRTHVGGRPAHLRGGWERRQAKGTDPRALLALCAHTLRLRPEEVL